MKQVLKCCLLLVCSTGLLSTELRAEAPAEPTRRDVPYGAHPRQTLDLWHPTPDSVAPLVIFIHGGGWAGGDKQDVPAALREACSSRGIALASINYRYSTTARLPAPVHDAARAVQFLRQEAAGWKLDPQRFAAYGISAGGCTTLWLACHDDLADPKSSDPVARQSTRLQAAVGMSAQTCLEPRTLVEWLGPRVLDHPMMARAVGAKVLADLLEPTAEQHALLAEFSPLRHLTRDDPPMLLSYPKEDPLPAASAGSGIHHALLGRKFADRATEVGATCTLRIESTAPAEIPTPVEFLSQKLRR